ncbi:hypothetical protein RUND412_002491 [Rhizina undulata]
MGRNGFIDIRDLPPVNELVKRVESPDGTCGGTDAYTCGTTVNKCCSQYGWCGDTDDYCLTSMNCQAAFGICTTAANTTTSDDTSSTSTAAPISGRCGTQGNGEICPTGQCCSDSGYCGTTEDYCQSPLCQVGFGTCDADITPAGESTEDIARPHVGSVPYDAGLYHCNDAGEIALTYDDGPYIYTDGMLDVLASYGAKATFFITGINNGKGAIDTTPAWSAVITKMYQEGHQLASHTWSHPDLSTLTEERRRGEMIKLEMALRNIVGFFPTYMRPPYSSCDDACVATMQDLGYHISYFDVDTDDYDNETPELIQNAKNNFFNAISPVSPLTGSFLTIAHDIHQQTAQNLTAYMLDLLQVKGYKAVTLGQCLGDPEENWYRGSTAISSSITSTTAAPTTAAIATTTGAPTLSNPTTTTSSLTGTSTCVYSVSTFCATALPTYTDISECWVAVGNCWDQNEICWNTLAWPTSAPCSNYVDACTLQEAHCQECVANESSNGGTCAFLTPVYGTAVPNP